MTIVRLTGFLAASDLAAADHAARHLDEHIRLTRAEPGCLSFDVSRLDEDPLRFRVSETFRDAAAFAAHQARTRASAWAHESRNLARDYTVTGL